MLERAISLLAGMGIEDRRDALIEISTSIDIQGAWGFAKMYRLLDEDNSCENFMIEFMTAYNNEISKKY